MPQQPTLTTERLILRPFTTADAPAVQRLAGDWDVAKMIGTIPHPYEDGMAEAWIASHAAEFDLNKPTYAVVCKDSDKLIGAIDLHAFEPSDNRAELGYWIGKPYWNQGFATEATKEFIRYGFEVMGLNRIAALHYRYNPASGAVMQKAGMWHEATLQQHARSRINPEEYVDDEVYVILKETYQADAYIEA